MKMLGEPDNTLLNLDEEAPEKKFQLPKHLCCDNEKLEESLRKNPMSWSTSDTQGWLLSLNIPYHCIPGEKFSGINGERLCSMRKEEFVTLDPQNGSQIFSHFQQLLHSTNEPRHSSYLVNTGKNSWQASHSDAMDSCAGDYFHALPAKQNATQQHQYHHYSAYIESPKDNYYHNLTSTASYLSQEAKMIPANRSSFGIPYSVDDVATSSVNCNNYSVNDIVTSCSNFNSLRDITNLTTVGLKSVEDDDNLKDINSFMAETVDKTDASLASYPFDSFNGDLEPIIPTSVDSFELLHYRDNCSDQQKQRHQSLCSQLNSDESASASHDDDEESDEHEQPQNNISKKRRKKNGGSGGDRSDRLWQFFCELLRNSQNDDLVRWESEEEGIFRILQSERVAQMWGLKKHNSKMNYEKMSRSIRFCRSVGYFDEIPRDGKYPKRLIFKFGSKAAEWRTLVS